VPAWDPAAAAEPSRRQNLASGLGSVEARPATRSAASPAWSKDAAIVPAESADYLLAALTSVVAMSQPLSETSPRRRLSGHGRMPPPPSVAWARADAASPVPRKLMLPRRPASSTSRSAGDDLELPILCILLGRRRNRGSQSLHLARPAAPPCPVHPGGSASLIPSPSSPRGRSIEYWPGKEPRRKKTARWRFF
jgi:hypothetical protein